MSDITGKRFVISRSIAANLRIELRRQIIEAGGIVQPRVSGATDFRVVTPADDWLDQLGPDRQSVALTVRRLEKMLNSQMTLSVVDGVEHLLDTATGAISQRFPAAVHKMPRLKEREVTQERVEQILAAAGIRTSRDSDDDTLAHALGEEINILYSAERRFVRFVKLVDLPAFVSEEAKTSVVTRLNNEFDVVRFRLWREDAICLDYSMSYEHGMSPSQLVSMLLGVAWVVRAALKSEIAAELLG